MRRLRWLARRRACGPPTKSSSSSPPAGAAVPHPQPYGGILDDDDRCGRYIKAIADTDKFRLLHTMIRVRDLDASLQFYTDLLGMKLLRKRDYPTGKFTLAFVGYGDETSNTVIELTHNWDQPSPITWGAPLVIWRLVSLMSTRPASASPRQVSRYPGPPVRWHMAARSSPLSRIRTAIGSSWSSAPNNLTTSDPPRSQRCARPRGGVSEAVRPAARPARNGGRLSR